MKKILFLFCIILSLLLTIPNGYFVLQDSQYIAEESPPPYEGTTAYLINLDQSIDRLKYILPNLKKLEYNIDRISAIYGAEILQEEFEQKVDLENYLTFLGHYPKKGTIGCSLSHFIAWKKFLKSKNEYAIIFEDDVSFNPSELSHAIEILKKENHLWDLVTFEISHSGTPLTIKKLGQSNHKLSVYITEISHTGAYIINRKAAKNLVSKFLPIKMPVDHYFSRSWELDFKFLGIEPRIVKQTFGDSDINKTTISQNQKNLDFLQSFHKAGYKLQSYLMRFFYNMKIYFSYKKAN